MSVSRAALRVAPTRTVTAPAVLGEAERRLAVTETVTVGDLPDTPATLDVWYPLPPDGPGQGVLDVRIASDALFQRAYDPDHGNPMAHVRFQGPLPRQVRFHVEYLISRTACACHADGIEELRRAASLLERARERAGPSLSRARSLLDRYRSTGLQARLISGLRPTEGAAGPDVELDTHHWVEVFVPEVGWLPADPSCDCQGDGPFRLGLDHVVRSRGDDLLLLPVQRGGRLPTFSETYAELGGRRHPVLTRRVMRRPEPEAASAVSTMPPGRTDVAGLLRRELPTLRPAPHVVRLAAGANLTLASCEGQWLFLLLEGLVRLSRLSPGGKKLELGMYEAPELFLGARLLHGIGEAVHDSTLVTLTRDQAFQLTSHQPDLASLVLETLSDRMAESDERMEYLAYHSLASRVAMALLRLCDAHGLVDGMTHQQIGDIVGAYRETVTKVLHEFKRDGLVRLSHRRIELLDPLTLTRLMEE